MVAIDGVMLPYPTKYLVSMSDLDSSDTTRNEAGVLVRNRVRQGVAKLELAFTLRGKDVSWVMSLIAPDKVQVEYFDPRMSEPRTMEAYVGDRSCNVVSYNTDMLTEEIWWEVSFNLIEY